MHNVSEAEWTELGDVAAVTGYKRECSTYHNCPVQIVWVAESLSMIVPETQVARTCPQRRRSSASQSSIRGE